MAILLYNYTKGQMKYLAIGFMIVPTFFFGLRIWAKLLIKRVAWDDYLAGAALLISITCCSLQLATTVYGHLGQHQPTFPDGSPMMDDPGIIFFEDTKFVLHMISILGLGLVKSSVLVLYQSIFPNRKFYLVTCGVLVFVIGWTVSFFFSHLFTCYPITAFIEPYFGNSCVKIVPMLLSQVFIDVIADFIILILPVGIVMKVQLPLKKRLAVVGMLGLGAAVCVISVTRVLATFAIAEEYGKHPKDVMYYTTPVFFWTNIELSLAIICACLPTLRPIWVHFFPEPTSTGRDSYNYGSSRRMNYSGGTSYQETDKPKLTREYGKLRLLSLTEQDIVKGTTIHQTIGALDGSRTEYLPQSGRAL
ncbi:hypothetical protein LZ31DRAFT_586497 [Colletotrichum somersetense]|nr:hypothetical protein LZ31DRAFT_586497 [Colletotrichum somersetense]